MDKNWSKCTGKDWVLVDPAFKSTREAEMIHLLSQAASSSLEFLMAAESFRMALKSFNQALECLFRDGWDCYSWDAKGKFVNHLPPIQQLEPFNLEGLKPIFAHLMSHYCGQVLESSALCHSLQPPYRLRNSWASGQPRLLSPQHSLGYCPVHHAGLEGYLSPHPRDYTAGMV